MKKRLLSLLLAVCLCFGMTAYAFAVDGIDYPEAGDLNLETQIGSGHVILFWDMPREIEVPIVDQYAYCRNTETEETIWYLFNPGETIAEFGLLENGVEYNVGVVYIYETGHEVSADTYILPLGDVVPELAVPDAAAISENGTLTIRWAYPGDASEVAYYYIEVTGNDETLSFDFNNTAQDEYSYTFDRLPYDHFLIFVRAVDHQGNYSEPAVIEYSENTKEDSAPVWPFIDVTEDHPNYKAIRSVYNAGLMLGTGDGSTFSPDMNLSRAMVARILHTLVGNPTSAPSTFTDVNRNFWYTNAIDWASNYKVISGNGQGQFMPNTNVTREQLAVMLYHFAKATGFDVSVGENTNILSYYDALSISSWARSAVQWACATDILEDDGYGNLLPTKSATRAEVAEAITAFVMFYS